MNKISNLFMSSCGLRLNTLKQSTLLNISPEIYLINKRISTNSKGGNFLGNGLHTGYFHYQNSNDNSLNIKHNFNKHSVFDSEATTNEYLKCNAWGMLTSVDVKLCNPNKIRSKDEIKRYVLELCDLINMKRYGPTVVTYFGSNAQVEGYSMMQFIETSMISGHFANCSNSLYIDIFSCSPYDPKKVANFTRDFFEGKDFSYSVLLRE